MTGAGLHCAKIALEAEGIEMVGAKPRQAAEVEDSGNVLKQQGIVQRRGKEG